MQTRASIDPLVRVPTKGARLPQAPAREQAPRRRLQVRHVRRAVVVLVLALLVYEVQNRFVATLIYQQRQQHLAAQLEKPRPDIESGDALGIVQIESHDVNVVFVEGVSIDHLRGGPAHLAGSALPGDAGVMVLYGHRTAYGGPFRHVADVASGDSIVVQARNGGPIVRYIVDRVERDAAVADVELPQQDQIAYLLLVTSEGRFLGDDQVVVVARALPVTEAPAFDPDLDLGVPLAAPLGVDGLLALVAFAGAVLAGQWLRGRTSPVVLVVATAPMAVFAVVRLLMLLDSAFPITR